MTADEAKWSVDAVSDENPVDTVETELQAQLARVSHEPIEERAARFAELHDQLLAELERSDHGER